MGLTPKKNINMFYCKSCLLYRATIDLVALKGMLPQGTGQRIQDK